MVTFPRLEDGQVVGYQGVVQDVTAVREAERARHEFLAMVTQDLRSPITTILGLGVTLEAYAEELSADRIRRTGASIRRQAERISPVADDLYEVSRLDTVARCASRCGRPTSSGRWRRRSVPWMTRQASKSRCRKGSRCWPTAGGSSSSWPAWWRTP